MGGGIVPDDGMDQAQQAYDWERKKNQEALNTRAEADFREIIGDGPSAQKAFEDYKRLLENRFLETQYDALRERDLDRAMSVNTARRLLQAFRNAQMRLEYDLLVNESPPAGNFWTDSFAECDRLWRALKANLDKAFWPDFQDRTRE